MRILHSNLIPSFQNASLKAITRQKKAKEYWNLFYSIFYKWYNQISWRVMVNKKLFLFIPVFFLITACNNPDAEINRQNVREQETEEATTALNTYTNKDYNITVKYPALWEVQTFENVEAGHFGVNIFKADMLPDEALPLAVREKMNYSYVSFWPEGLATELPAGLTMSFKDVMHAPQLNFSINRMESKLLLLKDQSIWAYFLVPRNPPENWSNYGFIYAQVGTEEVELTCFDEQTGQEISMEECDHLEGDRVKRTANIDEEAAKTIRNILESISLEPVKKEVSANGMIEVGPPETLKSNA